MTVRFIQQWEGYRPGDIATLDYATAATLVKQCVCMQIAVLPPMETR